MGEMADYYAELGLGDTLDAWALEEGLAVPPGRPLPKHMRKALKEGRFWMLLLVPLKDAIYQRDGWKNPRLPADIAPRSIFFDEARARHAAALLAQATGRRCVVLAGSPSPG